MKMSKKFKREVKQKVLLFSLIIVAIISGCFAMAKFNGKIENFDVSKIFVGETGSVDQTSETNFISNDSDSEKSSTALMSSSESNFSVNSTSEYDINNAQIASGNLFELALKPDGTVWSWGNNSYGQLGNGNIANEKISQPNQVLGVNGEGKLSNIKQISVGESFAIALTDDGKVLAWGQNTYGQLGNNTTDSSGVPVYVQDENGKDIENIKQISAGSFHGLAVSNDGTVYSWGLNSYGQLGLNVGNTTASNADYKRVVAQKVKQKNVVTSEDGTESTEIGELDNIKQVSGGHDFSVALTNDGEVYTWGLGTSGQLGNGGAVTSYIPVKVGITNVTKVDAGGLQTLALKDDKTVWSWGINRYGNLGINTSSTSTSNAAYKKTTPVQVLNLENIVDIASNYETSFALNSDGELYGWGLNTSGEIGNGNVTNQKVASKVVGKNSIQLPKILKLQDGQNTSTNMFFDEEGNIYANGYAGAYEFLSDHVSAINYSDKISESYLSLSNNQEYLEIGKTLNLSVEVINGFYINDFKATIGNIKYKSSDSNIATVDDSGKVTAKSSGYVTIIAEDETSGYKAESIINVISEGAIAIPQVLSGTTFTAMLKEDGTVWTSGAAENGVTGIASNMDINIPTQVKIDRDTYLTDIRKIEVGEQHVIALKKDGTVWAWGLNSNGQLGNNTKVNSSYAIQVLDSTGKEFLKDVVDISAGYDFSIAVMKDKTVYGWGYNGYYGLGINSATARVLPTKMHDSYNVIQAQGGYYSTIVLKGDGTVWGTGYNNVGQLADGTTTNKAELVQSINSERNGVLTGIVRVASGRHHTIALKEDATAYIWGYNNNYQLGNNTTKNQTAPIDLKGLANSGIMENISNIGTGPTSTYIEDRAGNVYATGLNKTGELSIASTTTSKVFTVVKNETKTEALKDVVSLGHSTGTTYGFAFDDGTVGITGLGTSGQHANLTYASSNVITKIDFKNLYVEELYQLNKNETKTLDVKSNIGFNLKINKNYTVSKENLKFESLNTDIVEVDNNGVIKGISDGKTGVKITDITTNIETVAQIIVGERNSNIYKISAGVNHTIALKNDGTVWSWGDNTYGQLGDGGVLTSETENPIQVSGVNGSKYLSDVVDIASGTYFSIALLKNGNVVAWGLNNDGQLGNIGEISRKPVFVMDYNGNKLSGIVGISASRNHAIAVRADGTVFTWGSNDYGQLGNNTKTSSAYAIQVLDSTGNDYLKDVVQVSAGAAYVSVVKNDGTVWSWGAGASAQMGDGARTQRSLPVQAKNVTDVKKVATGCYITLVLKNDGTVWAWGLNRYGQLGIGVSSTSSSDANYVRTTAVQVKLNSTDYLTDVVDIGTAYESSFAVTSDGTAYAWGLNNYSQLGIITSSNVNLPTKCLRRYYNELEPKIIGLFSNSEPAYTNYMIREDGSILSCGKSNNGQLLDGGKYETRSYIEDVRTSYLEVTDKISTIKLGSSKKLSVRTVENFNLFAKAPEYGNLTWKSTNENIATVDKAGNVIAKKIGTTTIIVTEDLHGYRAQATINVTNNSENSIATPMIVQGNSYTAVLKNDGTVWMSGLNSRGQLGNGTLDYTADLTQVKTSENTYLTNIIKISAGDSHMLAMTSNGDVYTWGLNNYGQLGQNSNDNSTYAVKVLSEDGQGFLTNIIDISAGTAHSSAVDKFGNLYTWGKNANYQLGNHTTTARRLPIKVADAYNIVKVSCGAEYTMLVRGDGTALGTGLNTSGQLIMGDTTTKFTPLEIGSSTEKLIYKDVYDVIAGGTHTLVLREDGKAYSAGLGSSGQLSQSSTANSSKLNTCKILNENEELVDLENIANIYAGNATSFITTKDGKVYSAGLNTSGQLGLGNVTSPINTLTRVKDVDGTGDLEGVISASTGPSNSINSGYILEDGTVVITGTGSNGQLGNGTYFNTYLPVISGKYQLEADSRNVHMKVNTTENINLKVNQGFNVFNTIKTVGSNIKYESENNDVVTVTSTGVMTAKRIGKTRVKVTDFNNNITEVIEVTVSNSLGYTDSKISSGLNFTIALKEDGTVWSWGLGASGVLGTGNTNNQSEPVQVLSPD